MPQRGDLRPNSELATGSIANVGPETPQRSPARPARIRDFVYSTAARERISDKDALSGFIERIPWGLRTKSYEILPAPKGFQPRSDAGLKQKEKNLINVLTKPINSTAKADRKYWDALGRLWQSDGITVCGGGFSSLSTLDNVVTAEPNLDAARAHFKELMELLGPDRASKEVAERLFWASPFPTYPEWQSEISALPSEAELIARLERERLLERLGRQVDELTSKSSFHETALADLRQVTATATEQLRELRADIDAGAVQDTKHDGPLGELVKQFEILTAGVKSLGATVEELSETTQQKGSALEALTEWSAAADKMLSSAINRIDEVETLILSTGDELRSELKSNADHQTATVDAGGIVADNRQKFLVRTDSGSPVPVELVGDPEALFSALIVAFGSRGADIEHVSRLDIAIRARELPLLIGPHAREVSEAWMLAAAAGDPEIVWTDPTLLSLSELLPSGPRGDRAPLSRAFARALAQPERCVVVLLDDFDPTATSFWIADLARAIRQPSRYGFPENLVCVAVFEGEPAHIALPRQRAGELFPLRIDKLSPPRVPKLAQQPALRTAISRALLAPPRASSRWQDRVEAFRSVASALIPDDKLDQWVDAFANHLRHMKDAAPLPTNGGPLADTLRAASSLVSVEPKEKTNA